MANVLIVDDEPEISEALSEIVSNLGHFAHYAGSIEEAILETQNAPYDVVFLDINMPDGSGLDALPAIRSSPSKPEVIIITGFDDPNSAETAVKSGAWDYLKKPISPKRALLSIKRVLQYREQAGASPSINISDLDLHGIIGKSQGMQRCYEQLAMAAQSDANVLIIGETGTGKELFARAIHKNSSRKNKPFIVVDCGSIAPSLAESELFGHVKGSFTGADKSKAGLIRLAHTGTLFLDEVGELPLSIQKTFLRVLQEHRFRPVGSEKELESRFRVVAATNKDLEAACEKNTFRPELLFRLKGIVITLPPLRKRGDDIRLIAENYLKRLARRYDTKAKDISQEVWEILMAYNWPGNIRELINTLDRAFVAAHNLPVILPVHLPENIRIWALRNKVVANNTPQGIYRFASPGQEESILPFRQYREKILSHAEKEYLVRLMAHSGGNIQDACRISGLGRTRLYNLLKKHGIKRKSTPSLRYSYDSGKASE